VKILDFHILEWRRRTGSLFVFKNRLAEAFVARALASPTGFAGRSMAGIAVHTGSIIDRGL